MPEYTVLTAVAVAAVVACELLWLRTGIFTTARYWISMAIVFAFQVVVDGWLTKLSDPIVIYNPEQMLGVRIPWDIPIEDYGLGFAMVTLTILLWLRALDRRPAKAGRVVAGGEPDGRRRNEAASPRTAERKEL